jgi:uncharacterized pyridoxal phosphate-containing UPF0001 family protein
MTIGAYEASVGEDLNPDFLSLVNFKQAICEKLSIDVRTLELSMGMSHDFEQAVRLSFHIHFFMTDK